MHVGVVHVETGDPVSMLASYLLQLLSTMVLGMVSP